MKLSCIECNTSYGPNDRIYKCSRCGNLLTVEYNLATTKRGSKREERTPPSSVWRYRYLLPIRARSKIVSLGEGGTSLQRTTRLGGKLGLRALYVKNEGENPTGSFKDRGMTVGISKALELGVTKVICASTGNTSSSMSAYAAKAGLDSIVITPFGKTSLGKMSQALIYGANIIQVTGGFDEALDLVFQLVEKHREIYLLNSINPFRLEGQKTLAFEMCDQLGRVPEIVVVPVGNGGNLSAIWKGFKEHYTLGIINRLPKMIGVQAEGASPVAKAIQSNSRTMTPIENPETIATAIRIGSPANWKKLHTAILESAGTVVTVTDREILGAQRQLARYEGLFVEPASATSVAALSKLSQNKIVNKGDHIVCVTTGHGLKDPETAVKHISQPPQVDADIAVVEAVLGLTNSL